MTTKFSEHVTYVHVLRKDKIRKSGRTQKKKEKLVTLRENGVTVEEWDPFERTRY
jgi:hypothetical protein